MATCGGKHQNGNFPSCGKRLVPLFENRFITEMEPFLLWVLGSYLPNLKRSKSLFSLRAVKTSYFVLRIIGYCGRRRRSRTVFLRVRVCYYAGNMDGSACAAGVISAPQMI